MFSVTSADFQDLTVQGQVTWRNTDARRVAELLNYTLDERTGRYVSEDPEKFPQRVVNEIQVLVRGLLAKLPLRQALGASDALVDQVIHGLKASNLCRSLSLEFLSLVILGIKPTPEMARALEAEAREQLLRESDQAIYARRNAAVEQERTIKENELNTEIAVENKRRQIREAQMEAERSVQEKEQEIREQQMKGHVRLERQRQELVGLTVENARAEADARAYAVETTLKPLSALEPWVLEALAMRGWIPGSWWRWPSRSWRATPSASVN
jgi:hypothetical protein